MEEKLRTGKKENIPEAYTWRKHIQEMSEIDMGAWVEWRKYKCQSHQ